MAFQESLIRCFFVDGGHDGVKKEVLVDLPLVLLQELGFVALEALERLGLLAVR